MTRISSLRDFWEEMVYLLAGGPGVITPDVLADERRKYEDSGATASSSRRRTATARSAGTWGRRLR